MSLICDCVMVVISWHSGAIFLKTCITLNALVCITVFGLYVWQLFYKSLPHFYTSEHRTKGRGLTEVLVCPYQFNLHLQTDGMVYPESHPLLHKQHRADSGGGQTEAKSPRVSNALFDCHLEVAGGIKLMVTWNVSLSGAWKMRRYKLEGASFN